MLDFYQGRTVTVRYEDGNPSSQSTTTILSGTSSYDSIVILGSNITAHNNSLIKIICSDTYLLTTNSQFNRPTAFQQLADYNCDPPIEMEVTNGTLVVGQTGGGIVSITYVGISSSTMATDTPYTISKTVEGNTEYTYNPLNAQLGLTLWVLIFVATVSIFLSVFLRDKFKK